MAYKIWATDRLSASFRTQKSNLLPIVRILIESAALQLIVEILLLALYAANYNAQYILLEIVTPLVVSITYMAPTLCVLMLFLCFRGLHSRLSPFVSRFGCLVPSTRHHLAMLVQGTVLVAQTIPSTQSGRSQCAPSLFPSPKTSKIIGMAQTLTSLRASLTLILGFDYPIHEWTFWDFYFILMRSVGILYDFGICLYWGM